MRNLLDRFFAHKIRRGHMRSDSVVWSFVLPVDLERRLKRDDALQLRRASHVCLSHALQHVKDIVAVAFEYGARAAELRAAGEYGAATTYEIAAQRQVQLAIGVWIPFVLTVPGPSSP